MKKTASNAHIWTRCEGYIKAATDYIRQYGKHDSPAANEGIMAHGIAEALIRIMCKDGNPTPTVPDMWAGTVIPVDMKIKCRDYAHFCYSLMRRANVYGGKHLWVEDEVASTFLADDISTRVDFALYDQNVRTLHVIDLKYGHRPVDADDNAQLLIGARSIMDSMDEPVEKIVMSIYQPNGPSASMPLDQWATDHHNVMTKTDGIRRWFDSEGTALRPGSHCRYCDARGTCDGLRHAVYTAWDVVRFYNHIPEELPAERLEDMLAEAESFKDLLRAYETGLEALCISRIKRGDVMPKWEYTTSLTDRKWAHEEKDIIELARSMDIDLEKRTILSPKQAELAGMPKELVDTLVKRNATGLKLRKKSLKTLRQAFE
jgi:hypothetical protein